MTKKQTFDAKTGITTVVDFTAEEEAQLVIDKAAGEEQVLADEQQVADKASGNQKLLDLGLLQAEVDALTG